MGAPQESRHKAKQIERLAAVGELAAGVAHELHNPLTSESPEDQDDCDPTLRA